MNRPRRWLTSAVALTAGLALVACDPALPQDVTPAAPTTTVTVPASWSVPRNGNAACPATWTDPANPSRHSTFTGADWNAFVSGLTAGPVLADTKIVFPAGCYYLGSTVKLDENRNFSNVVIDGSSKGAWITQTWLPVTTTRDAIVELIRGVSDRVTIQNLRVVGSAPENVSLLAYPARSDQDVGIATTAGTNLVISGNEVSQTWSDPIYGSDVYGLLISNNTVYRSGRNGIAVTNGSDMRITGNSVSSVALIGIDLEPNPPVTVPLQRVRVDHNQLEFIDDSAYRSERGNGAMVNITAYAPVYDVTIDNNTSVGARLNVVLQGSQPIDRVLVKNNSSQSSRGSINVMVGTNVTVTDNTLTSTETSIAVNTRWSAGTCGEVARNVGYAAGTPVPFQNLGGPTPC